MKFQWNKIAGSYPLYWKSLPYTEEHYLKGGLMVQKMPLAIEMLHE